MKQKNFKPQNEWKIVREHGNFEMDYIFLFPPFILFCCKNLKKTFFAIYIQFTLNVEP